MTLSSPSRPYLEGKKLNKIEQNKANKDGLLVGSEIEKFAELGWEEAFPCDCKPVAIVESCFYATRVIFIIVECCRTS